VTARVAAVDLGDARVGVAISDELGLLAHPRPALDGRSRKPLLQALCELAREEGVTRFLVGLPLDMSGAHGPRARKATEFAQALADASRIEVELVDERLTTVEAARQLRDSGAHVRERASHRRGGKSAARAGKIDTAAATVMLQAWLDGRRGASR
jgi:putative Holliday junction resolvase